MEVNISGRTEHLASRRLSVGNYKQLVVAEALAGEPRMHVLGVDMPAEWADCDLPVGVVLVLSLCHHSCRLSVWGARMNVDGPAAVALVDEDVVRLAGILFPWQRVAEL